MVWIKVWLLVLHVAHVTNKIPRKVTSAPACIMMYTTVEALKGPPASSRILHIYNFNK